MHRMSHEDRGRAVGLINAGTHKQNIRVTFVFLSF